MKPLFTPVTYNLPAHVLPFNAFLTHWTNVLGVVSATDVVVTGADVVVTDDGVVTGACVGVDTGARDGADFGAGVSTTHTITTRITNTPFIMFPRVFQF